MEHSNSEKTTASRKHAKKTCAAGAVQAYLFNAPGETRTPNLLIRSQMLYPIELRAPIPTLVLFDETRIGP